MTLGNLASILGKKEFRYHSRSKQPGRRPDSLQGRGLQSINTHIDGSRLERSYQLLKGVLGCCQVIKPHPFKEERISIIIINLMGCDNRE